MKEVTSYSVDLMVAHTVVYVLRTNYKERESNLPGMLSFASEANTLGTSQVWYNSWPPLLHEL